MFDVMLSLDRVLNIINALEIDEPFKTIALCEAFDESGAMLKDSTDEIICHADIKNAVRTICQKINETACHFEIIVIRRGWPGQARP
jgi:hypothetical protein